MDSRIKAGMITMTADPAPLLKVIILHFSHASCQEFSQLMQLLFLPELHVYLVSVGAW